MLNCEQIQSLRNALLDLTAMKDFDLTRSEEVKLILTAELKLAANASIIELEQAFPSVWEDQGHDE